MNLLAELRSRFQKVLSPLCSDTAPYLAMIKVSQDPKFGDYQANFAMPLAKQVNKKPHDLAAEIIKQVELDDLCDSPEIAGPGFINLRLKADVLRRATQSLVNDDRVGVSPVSSPRSYVVDFSAPNVAKPMHVGHLRSTVIGDALYRILKFLGHQVIGDNHVGDWGTQFGMIIYGYKNFLNTVAFREAPVPELARLYRLVNQLSEYHEQRASLPEKEQKLAVRKQELVSLEATSVPAAKPEQEARKKALKQLQAEVKELSADVAKGQEKIADVENNPTLKALAESHPNIAVDARKETAKLHAGDAQNVKLWNDFVPQCLNAIAGVYQRLDVRFDHTLGESFYNPMLADVVTDLKAKGLATVSDGAVCVFIPGIEAPFIVQKSDGAYTYATTDLATIKYRMEHFHADSILYVVDARQADHFRLLFETARRWGYGNAEFQHVSFGTVLGEDGLPIRTRSGDSVGLESLLDESVSHARQIVDSSDDEKPAGAELDAATRAQISEIVGLGGIKYADLCQNRESDYKFSWNKMLAKTGDTATYMQYAYARVCGILRRGGINRESLRREGGTITLDAPAERALAVQLLRFPEVLDSVVVEYRPNFLTQYLFATANAFSTFFDQCPVLKAETEELRTSRLLLADITARVIAQGLQLLGIKTVEKM